MYEKKIAEMKQNSAARESEVNDIIKRESNTKARNSESLGLIVSDI